MRRMSVSKDQRPGDRHTGPPQRSVRGIDNEMWSVLQDLAKRRGQTASGVIRELIAEWTAKNK